MTGKNYIIASGLIIETLSKGKLRAYYLYTYRKLRPDGSTRLLPAHAVDWKYPPMASAKPLSK